MFAGSDKVKSQVVRSDWYRALSKYEKPHLGKAVWQLLNTFVPYFALWGIMVWMLRSGISYWYVLPLICIAAGLQVRIFIFFHDCGHNSFFASSWANRIIGYIAGVVVFTPYEDWRHPHAKHHATTADLDRRGTGDVWTLTVAEYLAAPKWKRIVYRLYRNPITLFIIGAPFLFLIANRLPHKGAGKQEKFSVIVTNLALLAIVVAAFFTIGLQTYLMIQVPMMTIAGAAGIWLFYVQHQFEGQVYWDRQPNWDPIKAALAGSSYYKLPKVLQWFSGNIGLHHIHHLRPRIPNYNLQKAYDEVPALQDIKPITLGRSFKSLFLNLWDESSQTLVSFRALKRLRSQMASTRS